MGEKNCWKTTDQCEARYEHVDGLNGCNQLTSGCAKGPEEVQGEVQRDRCRDCAQQQVGKGQIHDEVVAQVAKLFRE